MKNDGAALLAVLRRELTKSADPSRAAGMQAYMKSTMPYLGVSAVPLRAVCKKVFADYPFSSVRPWQRDVMHLWRSAQHREERYGALELSGDKRARAFHTLEILPMYEEIIVSGAWWDYVDTVATHRLDHILRAEPKAMKRAMLTWSRSDDMWKRRSSILCQITFKEETDLDLLYRCIAPSLSSKEFFLRKAIGWALRQYAWTDPREVVRYVREHDAELSGLSKREALKNV
ncbi:MAG: DNA alkylation repair protein [Polyangiaceae bacterium]